MSDALKIGIAGLGTVGASLARILQDRSEKLAVTCGRPITITAVSARDRTRDRGIDMTTTDRPVDDAVRVEDPHRDIVEIWGHDSFPASDPPTNW